MKASEINTIQDVIKFAQWNHDNKVIVHPDSDYLDFVTNAGKNTFTKAQAKELNKTMDKCHQVCKERGADIYEIFVNNNFLKHTNKH